MNTGPPRLARFAHPHCATNTFTPVSGASSARQRAVFADISAANASAFAAYVSARSGRTLPSPAATLRAITAPFSGLSQKNGSPCMNWISTNPSQDEVGTLTRAAPCETSIQCGRDSFARRSAERRSTAAWIAADSWNRPLQTTASAAKRLSSAAASTSRPWRRMHPLNRLVVATSAPPTRCTIAARSAVTAATRMRVAAADEADPTRVVAVATTTVTATTSRTPLRLTFTSAARSSASTTRPCRSRPRQRSPSAPGPRFPVPCS